MVIWFSMPNLGLKNVFHRETHFDYKRQKPHSCVVRIVRFTVFQRRGSDCGGAGRSVGSFRASLHAYGGTFDSVTCHQRRYHYLCLRIVALSLAIGCIQRGVARSARSLHLPVDRHPGAPAVRLPASRTYLPALLSFRGRCPLGLPSILLKQKSGPRKRKFAKEVKPRQKEIVCGRFLSALIAGHWILFGTIKSVCPIWFNTILSQASGKVASFRSRKYGMRITLSDPFIRFSTEAACYKLVWHLIVQTPLLGAHPNNRRENPFHGETD